VLDVLSQRFHRWLLLRIPREDFESDDTLVIHFADKPVVRETSQDWNTHVSFAADGSVVEVVILEARAHGAFPVKQQAA
jgi:hypothetical protein